MDYRDGFTVGIRKPDKNKEIFEIFQQGGYCNNQPDDEFKEIILKALNKNLKVKQERRYSPLVVAGDGADLPF